MTERSLFDDKDLVSRLKTGDESALTILYRQYWKPLYGSAFNILRDHQLCEDIVQEIFVTLWNRREQLEIRTSVKAYLFASARYEVFRQVRYGSVHESIADQLQERLEAPSPSGSIEYKELVSRINDVVEILPEKCRQVYRLSREKHLSHKEIANELHISTKTVENHLTKALRQLKNALGSLVQIVMFLI